MSTKKVSESKLDSLQNAEVVLTHEQTEAAHTISPITERTKVNGERKNPLTCVPGQNLSTCPTNLDLTSPRGKALAFNAIASADFQLDANQPTKITAHNYLAFPAEIANPESGEISQVTFVALFDAYGKFLKTTSDVVAARVGSALTMYKPEDWKNGIHFIVVPKVSIRTKRTYHDIRIDVEAYK